MSTELIYTKTSAGFLQLSPEKVAGLEALEAPERKLIEASLTVPLKKESPENALDAILETIASAYAICGQPMEPMQGSMYAQEVYGKIMEKYPMCTLKEISLAITNGVYDEYGQYYGLNAKTFLGFVKAYLFSESRSAAKQKYLDGKRAALPPAPPAPPYHTNEYWTETMITTWKEITEQQYSWYCRTDHLTHLVEAVPEAIYWLMKRHEMFSITDEYKSTLTEAAKRKYRHEVLKNVTGLHVTEVQRLLGCIDADSDVEVKKAIRMIAKRIAVIQVFDRCISNNQHTVFND